MEKIFVAYKGSRTNTIKEMSVAACWDAFGHRVSESSFRIEEKVTYQIETPLINKFDIDEIEIGALKKHLIDWVELNVEHFADSKLPFALKCTPTVSFAVFESFEGWHKKHNQITDWFLTKGEAEEAALEVFEELLFSYENEVLVDLNGEICQIGLFTNQEDANEFLNFGE